MKEITNWLLIAAATITLFGVGSCVHESGKLGDAARERARQRAHEIRLLELRAMIGSKQASPQPPVCTIDIPAPPVGADPLIPIYPGTLTSRQDD